MSAGSAAQAAEAAVDALLAGIEPGLPPPAVVRREVVLVTGPWLAGTTSVVTALRSRLPDRTFVEEADLAAREAPLAVVFVVSAAAPLTASDCELLDSATARTDTVIAVVSKIDVHRDWRAVLEANRAVLTGHADRYAGVAWVGAAAAPGLGSAEVTRLVDVIRAALDDADLPRRNRLRAWQSRLAALAAHRTREVEGSGREARLAALRDERRAALRRLQLDRSHRAIAVRTASRQAQVQLSHLARSRCAALRSELQEDVATMTRRDIDAFVGRVRGRVAEVVTEVDLDADRELAGAGREAGVAVEVPAAPPVQPVEVPAPPVRARSPERRLMMLLGVGFGLGVALTLSRLFAGLAPGWTAAGGIGCGVIGAALAWWMVGTRRLLHDRAVLDRWVVEVAAGVRAVLEERAATRVVAAESLLSTVAAQFDAAENARLDDVVARIDREVREHVVARARAEAVRDRQLPTIMRALAVVRAELGEVRPTEPGSAGAASAAGGKLNR